MTLNRTQLKYIAVAAMLVDHIGMIFIPITTPLGVMCRIVGRLTAPIMCMFLAEGYRYTHSKTKYALRLFIFALISQPFYAFIHNNSIIEPDFNMIFTLFMCFMVLYCCEKISNKVLRIICVVLIIRLSGFGDWGIVAPLWVLCFYNFGGNKKIFVCGYLLVVIYWLIESAFRCVNMGYPWYAEYCQVGLVLFLPLMNAYNGEKGSDSAFSKWFFYVFYPLHLLVLSIADKLV